MLEPGKKIGAYEIMAPLSEGGMGVVVLARHRLMNRTVALKWSKAYTSNMRIVEQMFRREIEATARVSHENVLTIFDAGVNLKNPYMVTEYITGGDLQAMVDSQGRLPVQTALEYVKQAAQGLIAIHTSGIIHRDIKPGNLLISETDRVRIIDFGICKLNQDDSPHQLEDIVSNLHENEPETRLNPMTAAGASTQTLVGATTQISSVTIPNPDSYDSAKQITRVNSDRMTIGHILAKLTSAWQRITTRSPVEPTVSVPASSGAPETILDRIDTADSPATPVKWTGGATVSDSGSTEMFFDRVLDTRALDTIKSPHEMDDRSHTNVVFRASGNPGIGTPEFVSPEQWVNPSSASEQSDIYSLGCTLFFLLTGEYVAEGNSTEILANKSADNLRNIGTYLNQPPPGLGRLLSKMLAIRPGDRYASVEQLYSALDSIGHQPKIFISYRRKDTIDATDRLYTELLKTMASTDVFLDTHSIPYGADFRDHIVSSVARFDLMLVMIGDHWLECEAESNLRQIEDPSDFVRIEIESALERQLIVIPVLVGLAEMPSASSLPLSVRELAFRNAALLRAGKEYGTQLESLRSQIYSSWKNKYEANQTD